MTIKCKTCWDNPNGIYVGAGPWGGQWNRCPDCGGVTIADIEQTERDNQRRINNVKRAAKSAADMALYQPYNAINNEEHLK